MDDSSQLFMIHRELLYSESAAIATIRIWTSLIPIHNGFRIEPAQIKVNEESLASSPTPVDSNKESGFTGHFLT